ncbi:MAG: PhoH family protein [Candidatus Brocadiia bacterium]|jgi:phosphate starvation-inducible PhoH-like protein
MAHDGERASQTFHIDQIEKARVLLGRQDRHLRLLRDTFDIRVFMRGHVLTLEGDAPAVQSASKVVTDLLEQLHQKPHLSAAEVEEAISGAIQAEQSSSDIHIEVFTRGRAIRPRTPGQAAYLKAMAENDLVFCVGPAGSGKTYLAVAMAVAALKRDAVRKIILTRPAVEAGERLGFLPGDMQAKVDPYLRPLYDALHDMMPLVQLQHYVESDVLEVAPLAYMRGRNLDRAFIILDEGQNCTRKQMQMFLTRLGASSKSIVTGDISQTDLPPEVPSGMVEAMALLRDVQGIGFTALTQRDIVRHRLVQDIVDAYEARDNALLPAGPAEGPDRPG